MNPNPSSPRQPHRPPSGRLLLVARDESLALSLAHRLSEGGFAVDWAHAVDDVAAAVARGMPQGVLADIDSAGPDAFALLDALLPRLPPGVVVLLLGATDPALRARLLDRGADDCLRKPVELDELPSRVRAVLRRGLRVRSAARVMRHGPLELHTELRQLRWHDQPVAVTSMELRLLEILLRRPQHLFPRSELEALLYGWQDESASNTVEVYVHHLRRKICPAVVQTVRGGGYRLGAAGDLAGVARRGDVLN